MSEKEKKALVEKIQGIEKKFRSGQEKIQADLQKVQQEELSRIRAIVEKAITDHAEKNDFDIVADIGSGDGDYLSRSIK